MTKYYRLAIGISAVVLAATLTSTLSSCSNHSAPELSYRTMATLQNGGAITGTVTYNGVKPAANPIIIEKDQDVCGTSHPNPADPGPGPGIRNVIVYLEKVDSGKAFPASGSPAATIDQKHCEFVPNVQVIKLGTPIHLLNSDDVTHNAHFFLDGRPIENKAQPAGAPPVEVMLDKPGLYNFNCDVHPWMRGFVMVADNPYYAMTDSNGHYTIDNIPPGSYTVKVWRENWTINQPKGPGGEITSYDWEGDYHNEAQVEVKPSATTTTDFKLQ